MQLEITYCYNIIIMHTFLEDFRYVMLNIRNYMLYMY